MFSTLAGQGLNLAKFLLGAENADELSLGYHGFYHAAAWLWLTAVQCVNLCPCLWSAPQKLG